MTECSTGAVREHAIGDGEITYWNLGRPEVIPCKCVTDVARVALEHEMPPDIATLHAVIPEIGERVVQQEALVA